MKITREDVLRVADLAYLDLTDAELQTYRAQIDEILELLETQLTSSEVFTALFELEMTGRIRQLPGKNYVRTL